MKLLIAITIFILFLASCKVTEKMIPGEYQASTSTQAKLRLNKDKTFDLKILNPGQINSTIGDLPYNFTAGIWQLKKNRLKLLQPRAPFVDDSITRFTNISCLNFWDRAGDPVYIRYILVPPSGPRPHFGNSLYFFSQDFKSTDTLTFYFDGYPPFRFPGSIPSTIGNNMHKITMQEPDPGAIPQLIFMVRKNRLILLPKKFSFIRRQDAK